MANILNTRIRLKYDTLANWSTLNPELLSGELAVVSIPSGSTEEVNSVAAPQILFKVGPGKFNDLPYASGKAADVYAWAKVIGSDVFTKDGNGNVVSGIEYDATLNDGKGGFKFTTASVATSEGLEKVQDDLADLLIRMIEVEGELVKTSAGFERISSVESSIEELDGKFAGYYTKGEADGKFLTEHQDISGKADKTYVDETFATKDELNGVDAKFASYRTSADQDVIDNGIKGSIETLSGTVSSNYTTLDGKIDAVDAKFASYRTSEAQDAIDATFATKTELGNVDAKFAGKQDTITDLETIRSGAALGATSVQSSDIADMLTKTEAGTTYATKTELGNVDAKFANYNTKSEVELMISNEATRADAYADKAVSDFKDFLLGDGATDAIDTIKDLADALASHEDAYDALLETVGKKAEKTYVDEEIGKVSKSVTDLGTSTDTRLDAIEAQLGLGGGDSDTGSVTEQLAAHALTLEDHEGRIGNIEDDYLTSTDKTELEGKISPKADKTYVDEELGKKVNLSDYNTKVENFEGRIAANEAAVATVDSRIETAVSGEASRVNGLVDGINSDIEGIENAHEELVDRLYGGSSGGDIGSLESDINLNASAIRNIEEELGLNSGENRLEAIENNISNHEERVATLEAKKTVEYYEGDFNKDEQVFIICCGSASDVF